MFPFICVFENIVQISFDLVNEYNIRLVWSKFTFTSHGPVYWFIEKQKYQDLKKWSKSYKMNQEIGNRKLKIKKFHWITIGTRTWVTN